MLGSDPGIFSIYILSQWFSRGERGNIDRAERTEDLMNEYAGIRPWNFSLHVSFLNGSVEESGAILTGQREQKNL
jgi:hypothetical protein